MDLCSKFCDNCLSASGQLYAMQGVYQGRSMQNGGAETAGSANLPGGDDCVTRVAGLLDAIDACPDGAIFTRVYREEALAQALRLDRLHVDERGPLWGVVVSVKDMFDIKSEVTVAGCARFLKNPPASKDAEVVSRLRLSGAIIIGKTSMPELAYSGLGLNSRFGTPRNAIDPACIPGGSSSGAAVAIAQGLCTAAVGSDTGGSIRIPAAFNGVVGFKPTQSRVPRDGMAELSRSQDAAGLIARNVSDCALVDAVMAGDVPSKLEPRPLTGLKVAVPDAYFTEALDQPVALAFERSLGRLSLAGASLSRIEFVPGEVIGEIMSLGGLVGPESYKRYHHLLDEPDAMDPFVFNQMKRFAHHHDSDYKKALALRGRAQALYEQAMADFDVLVCPTVPMAAPRFDDLNGDEAALALNRRVLRNTSPFNTLDVPAITLPCQRPGEAGVGLMLVGKHLRDFELLRIAGSVESAL
ncbi:amidase [Pusillimonas caeni]|uniref:amidase family protein n=1 Tax=Pusillimonas caeni TaxID=1348472 RepID=UPI000E59CD3C|nr:amidase family protein [Pusillimonas caeni]TFL15799.1 amidase [Pusillimonas caeni]